MIPAWLSSGWAKLAAAALALAGLLAGKLLYDRARRREGAAAERARSAEAALRHERETQRAVSRADAAVADPRSERARRVRRLFERDDDAAP